MQKNNENALIRESDGATWPDGQKVHMVGIGGSGMSSLALFLQQRGAIVSGSDRVDTTLLRKLKGRGIRIDLTNGKTGEHEPDLLVHSAAVDPAVIDRCAGGRTETVKYAAMLSRVMRPFTRVAVAGTHGKTSVSALLAWLLKAAGWSPSYVIGGEAPDLDGGGACGTGEYFVAEACEYDRSFLNLMPDWAVITNLESDHLDYYKTFEGLCRAFEQFIQGVAERAGHLVIWDQVSPVLKPARFEGLDAWTYGFSDAADLKITDYDHVDGKARFRLRLDGRDLGRFALASAGKHSVLNAAAASLTALKMGMDAEEIRKNLPRFRGVNRRLEDRGVHGGVRIFSDYAHHPTEIRAVLEAMRLSYPGSRLVVAYQGHQMWRTGFFFEDFGRVLAQFDQVMILETYSVREKDTDALPGGEALVQKINDNGGTAFFAGDLERAPARIMPFLKEGDILILMGAGSIDEISGFFEQAMSIH